MGIYDGRFSQLASSHVGFIDARCAVLWGLWAWFPFHEQFVTRAECGARISGAVKNDPQHLAIGGLCCIICMASVASRIGCLGGRTEGCAERIFFLANLA